MPRPAFTPEQKREIRNNIRDAALKLSAERRRQDVTVRAIAAEAGVSVGAFYKYFDSLDDLAVYLWREPIQALREKMQTKAQKTKDPIKRIRALLECYAEFESEQPILFRRAFFFVRPTSIKQPDRQPPENEIFYDLLRTAIIEGQASGQIKKGNAKEIAQMLWASVHGSLVAPINFDMYDLYPSQKMAKKMIKHMCDSIRT